MAVKIPTEMLLSFGSFPMEESPLALYSNQIMYTVFFFPYLAL